MPSRKIRCDVTLLIWLMVILYAAGCGLQTATDNKAKGKDSFACGDQTVGVVPSDGVSTKDVYLCKGDTLTWEPNGHSFVVTFPKKYPFQGPPKTFQNDANNPNAPVTSPPAIYTGSLVVYRYDMTVDGNPAPDPQVVGGGKHGP